MLAMALTGCLRTTSAQPPPPPAPAEQDECTRLRAPIEAPADPRTLDHWRWAGAARAKLLDEVFAIMADRPCAEWDVAMADVFTSHAVLLEELRRLRLASLWHFDRWADLNSPTIDQRGAWNRDVLDCGRVMSPAVAAEFGDLTVYRDCMLLR